VERSPVKVMSGSDRALVDGVRIPATVAELNGLPIPEVPHPNAGRPVPHELRTYRVRAVLAQVLVEDDWD
jgi:hypothetical protein